MAGPDGIDPPFRFSLVRLILFVNLFGIGVIPLTRASWRWIAFLCLTTLASFFITLFALKLDDDQHDGPVPERRYSSVESALWLALGTFLLFSAFLYVSPWT